MKIKVVNAGNCMICGKPIKLVVPRGHGKLLNACLCRKCDWELKARKRERIDELTTGKATGVEE